MSRFSRTAAVMLAAISFVLLLVGCSSDSGGKENVTAADIQAIQRQQIKDIENNPNMPQAAKDQAIGALKSRGNQGGTPPVKQ